MKLRIGAFLLVLAISVGIAYKLNVDSRVLPIYNPKDINPKLVDESLQDVTQNHRVAEFSLTNQYNETVTNANFENCIYVADFFFTTCESICPKMSGQMQRLNAYYKNDEEIKLLSHTVFPETDSVPLLYDYSKEYNAIKGKWHLVTGDKKQIYDLARKSYFAVTTEGDGGKSDFIHTENFVLVDKQKRIRGFYDGTSQEEVNQLIKDIKVLQKEG